MKHFIAALAVVSTAAFAQGSPLLSARTTALQPAEAAKMTQLRTAYREVRGVQAVNINPAALNASVITLTLNGREHRLTGAVGKAETRVWVGQGDDAEASLVQEKDGRLWGNLRAGPRYYVLEQHGTLSALLELDPPDPQRFHNDTVAPASARSAPKGKR